jgi:hypothetical protein
MRIRILVRYLCVLAALVCPLAAVPSAQDVGSRVRLMNVRQGVKLVNTAREQKDQVKSKPDCSHLVHQIYELSDYPILTRVRLISTMESIIFGVFPHRVQAIW